MRVLQVYLSVSFCISRCVLVVGTVLAYSELFSFFSVRDVIVEPFRTFMIY